MECQTRLLTEQAGDRMIHVVKVSPTLQRLELCPVCRNRIEPTWDDNDRMSRVCNYCEYEEIDVGDY